MDTNVKRQSFEPKTLKVSILLVQEAITPLEQIFLPRSNTGPLTSPEPRESCQPCSPLAGPEHWFLQNPLYIRVFLNSENKCL